MLPGTTVLRFDCALVINILKIRDRRLNVDRRSQIIPDHTYGGEVCIRSGITVVVRSYRAVNRTDGAAASYYGIT